MSELNTTHHISLTRVRSNLIISLPEEPVDSTIHELQSQTLERIKNNDIIDGVVLDVSSVRTVDSFFARSIMESSAMIGLLGAKPVLSGISPVIAMTATELGYRFEDVNTAINTDTALDQLNQSRE